MVLKSSFFALNCGPCKENRFKTMKKSYLLKAVFAAVCSSFLLVNNPLAQAQSSDLFTPVGPFQALDKSAPSPQINVRDGFLFELNDIVYESNNRDLVPGNTVVLPLPGGEVAMFNIMANTTMSPVLSQVFPGIMTANIADVENRNRWGKIDLTPRGLHVMIFEPGQSTIFIDPVYNDNSALHVVYRKSEFETDKEFSCKAQGSSGRPDSMDGLAKSGDPYNSCELRTYRLALATTGEYTIFHGGTVEDAMAAVVTTMNRVNGIYERDFGVTMTLIEGNESLIFENPATDPFSNGNAVAMLQENQELMDNEVGVANYDIGHVFGTNSGGVAGLGVVCNGNFKARGVTGSAAPIGDPFDVDYVAHEIGHQFGANHTFNNSCNGNRNNSTAAEPGSGSTIMAYAGICNPNVQSNSDDHFHGVSMSEIGQFITQIGCAVTSPVDNTMPLIGDVPASVFVPVLTPFMLDAVVVDFEQDVMTFNWEQMDVEISTQPPVASSPEGPNFRSFSPDSLSVRYFPRLNALATNSVGNWERLPSVERNMNFRLSVRDNNPLAGCTQFADVEVNFVDNGGPFELLYPNAPAIVWQGLSYETVTWNVAGTTEAPINADEIDLYLSTSATPQFDLLIAEGVPNTGAYTVQVPNVATTTARIMAKAADGNFFDISGWNFTINAIEEGFAFEANTTTADGCQGDSFEFELATLVVGGLDGAAVELEIIDQPEGVTASLNTSTLGEGEVATLSVLTNAFVPPGQSQILVQGTAGNFVTTIAFVLDLTEISPDAPLLQTPFNGALSVPVNPTLQWNAVGVSDFTYDVDLALDPGFNEVVASFAGLSSTSVALDDLLPETTYFWRVRSHTACGSSAFSEINTFTTFTCILESALGVDEAIVEGEGSSTLSAGVGDIIAALSVKNLKGNYSNPAQLSFSLTGPDGSEVLLGGIACGVDVLITGNGTVEVTDASGAVTNIASSGTSGFGPGAGSGGTGAAGALALDGSGDNANLICEPVINPAVVAGKIAVIYRGECTFVEKVLNAQAAGAAGVVIINNQGNDFFVPGGNSNQITIPSVMIGLSDGNDLVEMINDVPEEFDLTFDDFAQESQNTCQTEGAVIAPTEALAAFVGTPADGVWQLTATDATSGGQGVIEEWSLEMCLEGALLSTSDRDIEGVQVFPNPTFGAVRLQWSTPNAYDRLYMTDLTGRPVHHSIVTGMNAYDVNMSHMAAGVYVVVLDGESGTFNSKVVLTR